MNWKLVIWVLSQFNWAPLRKAFWDWLEEESKKTKNTLDDFAVKNLRENEDLILQGAKTLVTKKVK